jgi:NAD(P)H-dependent nitrite reductase small subunit
MSWTRVIEVDRIPPDRAATVKQGGKQIAVFRVAPDQLRAVDNLCPHEGYPLSTGSVKDGVLTCEWHNWKFRLCDGVCVQGGEDVRSYPLRVEGGAVWLDLTDPPVAEQIPGLERALVAALAENDWPRVARTAERLLAAGTSPEAILGFGCDWAARHAPDGFDHGPATAADLASLFAEEPGVALLEALNLLCEPHLRRPEREFPPAEAPAADPAEVERELRRRIEEEDRAGTEALVRGAIEAGAGERVLGWLAHAATDHYLDFGHAEIYLVKAEELLGRIGWHHAHPVLTSLAGALVLGTREDRLPYMKSYRREMERYTPELARWGGGGGEPDRSALIAAVVDGGLAAALAAVASAASTPPSTPPTRSARAGSTSPTA